MNDYFEIEGRDALMYHQNKILSVVGEIEKTRYVKNKKANMTIVCIKNVKLIGTNIEFDHVWIKIPNKFKKNATEAFGKKVKFSGEVYRYTYNPKISVMNDTYQHKGFVRTSYGLRLPYFSEKKTFSDIFKDMDSKVKKDQKIKSQNNLKELKKKNRLHRQADNVSKKLKNMPTQDSLSCPFEFLIFRKDGLPVDKKFLKEQGIFLSSKKRLKKEVRHLKSKKSGQIILKESLFKLKDPDNYYFYVLEKSGRQKKLNLTHSIPEDLNGALARLNAKEECFKK